MIKLFDCTITERYRGGVLNILEDGNISTGPSIAEFEGELQSIYQKHCITFSDMTTALVQLFKFLRLNKGDLVLCHPFCCLSTTMAIKLAGLRVEWLDIDMQNLCIFTEDLHKKISRAKVLLNYNIAGYLPELSNIADLCAAENIILINDCNNAELSKHRGKFSAEYGDYSLLSFYPNRVFGSIDGAAILSHNDVSNTMREYQRLGVDQNSYRLSTGQFNPDHDIFVGAGCNNMSNLSARISLNRLVDFQKIMRDKREEYELVSSAFEELTVIPNPENEIVPWAIPIRPRNKPYFIKQLSTIGVESTELHYDNSQYTLFGGSDRPRLELDYIWIPSDVRIIEFEKEIKRYAE